MHASSPYISTDQPSVSTDPQSNQTARAIEGKEGRRRGQASRTYAEHAADQRPPTPALTRGLRRTDDPARTRRRRQQLDLGNTQRTRKPYRTRHRQPRTRQHPLAPTTPP